MRRGFFSFFRSAAPLEGKEPLGARAVAPLHAASALGILCGYSLTAFEPSYSTQATGRAKQLGARPGHLNAASQRK